MGQMVAFIAPGKDKGELVDIVGSWIHPFLGQGSWTEAMMEKVRTRRGWMDGPGPQGSATGMNRIYLGGYTQ